MNTCTGLVTGGDGAGGATGVGGGVGGAGVVVVVVVCATWPEIAPLILRLPPALFFCQQSPGVAPVVSLEGTKVKALHPD